MIHINESAIIGQKFNSLDPAIEYTCIGYAQNDTFVIVGAQFDSVNNRTTLRTFKMSDVKFMGQLNPVPK